MTLLLVLLWGLWRAFSACYPAVLFFFLLLLLRNEMGGKTAERERRGGDPNRFHRYGYFGWKSGDAWKEVIEVILLI